MGKTFRKNNAPSISESWNSRRRSNFCHNKKQRTHKINRDNLKSLSSDNYDYEPQLKNKYQYGYLRFQWKSCSKTIKITPTRWMDRKEIENEAFKTNKSLDEILVTYNNITKPIIIKKYERRGKLYFFKGHKKDFKTITCVNDSLEMED